MNSTSAQSFKNVHWKHVKGKNIYVITGFPLREKDLMPQVSYRRADGTGPEFTRICEEFFDGRYRTYLDFEEGEDEGIALDFNKRSLLVGDVVERYVGSTQEGDKWGNSEFRIIKEIRDESTVVLWRVSAHANDFWKSNALRYVRSARPEELNALAEEGMQAGAWGRKIK